MAKLLPRSVAPNITHFRVPHSKQDLYCLVHKREEWFSQTLLPNEYSSLHFSSPLLICLIQH